MRMLTQHIVEGDSVNHQLSVWVMDQPGAGGANHEYAISGTWTKDQQVPLDRLHGTSVDGDGTVTGFLAFIVFQNGPIKEAGVNGITNEALTAILIDRMEAFQSGPFACDENAEALHLYKLALEALKDRTRKRIARGVEGTHAA